jgi:hypothetical protein
MSAVGTTEAVLVKHMKALLAATVFISSLFTSSANAQPDPHRPTCASQACKKVERFVRAHYCRKSPFGNGPENGCDVGEIKKPANVRIVADYRCDWNGKQENATCKQYGQPSPALTTSLQSELRRLGLSVPGGETHYVVWVSAFEKWTLAKASYDRVHGPEIEECEVTAIFRNPTELHIVRELRCQKTRIEVPTLTNWSPIDIRDVTGDGRDEVVLEGDAYEDHWFEVISVGDDLSTKTIFSGLGYYL